MPLSRFQLRNEYGLGARELYNDASKREDPKAVLDGVAVAGLVGLLRQLGDLAEFAAEVFHGLQEDITTTASRSRKLMTRVKNIETALPPLEKAMLSQTSHIHFAYTPGTEWHPRIKIEQNHFIYTDLPRCIVDSYEECREPPRLPLLDRFDTGGPGSCLKRYSDPTFFRRASGNSSMLNDEKSNKDKKARKAKKRRSWKRSSQISFDTLNFSTSGRVQFSSTPRQRQPSPNQAVSAFDMTFKSDLVDRSGSLGSGDGMGYIECVFHPSGSVQTNESKTKHSLSGAGEKLMSNLESKYSGKQTLSMTDDTPRSSVVEKNGYSSSTDTWDEKASTVEPISQHTGMQEVQSLHKPNSEFGTVGMSGDGEVRERQEPTFQFDEPDIEPMGLNMRSYEVPELPETNFEADDPEIESVSQISEINEMPEAHETKFETDGSEIEPLDENCGGNEKLEVHETNLKPDEQEIERQIEECFTVIHTSFEGVDSPTLILDKNQCDEIESETDNFEDALNTIESESETDLDCQTKGQLRSCSRLKDDFQDDVDNERVAEREPPSLSFDDMDLCDSTSSPLPDCSESLQHTPASHDTLGELCEVPESFVSSVNSDVSPPLQSIQLSPVRDVSSEISLTKGDENANGLQKDSVGDEFLSSEIEETGMMAGRDEGVILSPRMSEQPSVASSNVAPVALWTNGGLFGLQPSKPPDFSTSGSANSNNGISSGHFNQNLGPKDVVNLQEELASSANDPRCDNGNKNLKESTLVSDNHEMDSSKKVPIPCLNSGVDKKLNSSIDSGLSNISAHSQSQLLPTMMHPEAKAPQCADVGNTSNKAIHVNEAKPSFLTGLGHGLLSNGFRRTRSMEYYEKPKEVSLEKKPDLDNSPSVTLRRSYSGTKLREEVPSVISGPPSPALEHMKISFQPINSFGTSKLKLKYPEGINHYDEDSDALFPSFQLVPEPALQHGIDSDSDNDTFCRSNPYISDDDLSHLSDSNSELWGSDYSSEIRDHTALNSLCRISSGDSISSLAEHEEMKNKVGVAVHASSSPLPDIPLLQAMNPFDLQELNPEAPPLPPLQWRVLKPQSDLLEGKEKIPDFTSLFSDLKAPGSSFPLPAKPASVDLVHTVSEHMNVTAKNKESGVQKLKVNARREDEREDFLEQIRTRSFNLRKTGLLKPAPTPVAPAPSVKVTAILQKANAIRQAVASDDGEEDDPWSDT